MEVGDTWDNGGRGCVHLDPFTVFASEMAWAYMKKRVLLNLTVLASASLFITSAAYFANILVFSSNKWVSPTDALFLEGIASLLVGLLLLLGRGGISYWSVKAAILAAAASAVGGRDTVGPSEIMRRDTWKSIGFLRLGLVLLLAGAFMIAGYFLTL